MLLLDEPTNDLDFDGLRLLERFVARTPGSDRRRFPRPRIPGARSSSADPRVRGRDPSCSRVHGLVGRLRTGGARAARAWRTRRPTSGIFGEGGASKRCAANVKARRRVASSRRLARETGGADRRATHALASKVRAGRATTRATRGASKSPGSPGACRCRSRRAAGAATSWPASRTPSSSAGTSRSGRSRWTSATGTAWRLSARTAAARRRCSVRSSGSCPLRAGCCTSARRLGSGCSSRIARCSSGKNLY